MKTFLFSTSLLLVLLFHSTLTAQSATSVPANTNTSVIDEKVVLDVKGYPTYKNTGNEEADKLNYESEKQKWIEANPELYNQYNVLAPAIQQQEKVNTDISNTLPGFPQYINTGNTTVDAQNYKAAKEKWISENQELYNQYLESLKINQQPNSNK